MVKTLVKIFTLATLFTILVVTPLFATEVRNNDGFRFNTIGGQMTITGFDGSGGNITIPRTAPNGMPVLAIGPGAFAATSLNNVNFETPSSIATIGWGAFRNSGLASINLPNSVTVIQQDAFEDNSRLTNITLPPNLVTIEVSAFANTALTQIEIPATVSTIGNQAFANAPLQTAHFNHAHGGNVSLGTNVFVGTHNNFVITHNPGAAGFPANWYPPHTTIPSNATAVSDWEWIQTTGNNIRITGFRANSHLATATRIEIPAQIDGRNVQEIQTGVFTNHPNLREVVIPSTVNNIQSWAFSDNRQLREVILLHTNGNNLTVASNAFTVSHADFTLIFPANSTGFTSPTWNGFPARSDAAIATGDWLWTQLSGNNIAITGIRTGSNLANATRIEIPSQLDGRTVQVINTSAFSNLLNAREIVVPNSVTEIQSWAFSDNSQLREVILLHTNGNLLTVANNAFAAFHVDFSIVFPANSTGFTTPTWRGFPARPSTTAATADWLWNQLSGNNIAIIGYRSDSSLATATRVEIPSQIDGRNVQIINTGTFTNHPNLQEVVIPSSVTVIQTQAFSNNSQLREVRLTHLNANNLDVASNAFLNSHGTFTLIFPANATGFTTPTWRGFPARSDATTTTTDWLWSQLTGNNVIITGVRTGSPLATATRLEIPSQIDGRIVQSIQTGAFANMPNLREVVIPSTVTTIQPQAFNNNRQLREVFLTHVNANVLNLATNGFVGSHADFTLIYPANATGFTTPTWRGFPARSDATAAPDWTWTPLTGNNIMITGIRPGSSLANATRIEIPSQINGLTVRNIQGWAFDRLPNLREVVFPNTITAIQARAFNENAQLREAYFLHDDGGVIELSANAFVGSHADFTIIFPFGARGFTTPTWHGFPTRQDTVEGLWEFTPLGSGVDLMITGYNGTAAVVEIPTTIDNRPVRYLGNEVFRDNSTITEVIIPESVVHVAANFVLNSPNFRVARLLHMQADILDMSGLAFSGVHEDFTIIFPADADGFTTPTWVGFPAQPDLLRANWNYTISAGAATITEYLGNDAEVEIPDSIGGVPVRVIATGAFRDNDHLMTVIIPASVQTIQPNAFHNCINLFSAVLLHSNANQLTNFAQDSFVGVAPHFRIVFPTGATGFTTPTWRGYFALPESDDMTTREGDFEFSIRREPTPGVTGVTRDVVFITGYFGTQQDLTIPTTLGNFPVVGFGDFTFLQNQTIRRITIPAGVTIFGYSTFVGASNLEEVIFTHSSGAGITLNPNLFRLTSDDFTIIYPAGASGFATPTWQGWPARSNAPTTPTPPTTLPDVIEPPTTPTPPTVVIPPTTPNLLNPLIHTNRTLDAQSPFMTRDGMLISPPIFRLEPFAPNPSFSTSYVMTRVIADILGLESEFDPSTNTASFSGYNAQNSFIVMEITINSSTMRVNGVPRDVRASAGVVPAILRNDRFFVPVLVFQEVFGVTIQWNASNATVTVNP